MTPADEPRVTYATVRDGEAEWHIECRFSDGQKFAAVHVDYDHEALAHFIAAALNPAAPADEQAALDAINRAWIYGTPGDGARDTLAALRALGWAPRPVVDDAMVERVVTAYLCTPGWEHDAMRSALLAALSPEVPNGD